MKLLNDPFSTHSSVTPLTKWLLLHPALTHAILKGKNNPKKTPLTVSSAPYPILSYPILNRTRFYHSLGPVTRVARIPYRGVLRPSRYTRPDRKPTWPQANPLLSSLHTPLVPARGRCCCLVCVCVCVCSAGIILSVGNKCVRVCVCVAKSQIRWMAEDRFGVMVLHLLLQSIIYLFAFLNFLHVCLTHTHTQIELIVNLDFLLW